MEVLLALLAVLLPILLVEGPHLSGKIDMGISGTYDVLVCSFLLPKKDVLPLLPRNLRSDESMLPLPSNIYHSLEQSVQGAAGREALHPVVLQMGYQISTGPGPDWLPKMSFNELKLEVPYLRHPSGKSKEPLTYKQYMIFSNTVIKLGSQGSGLRSATARFEPSNTPYDAPPESSQIQYSAPPFLEATAFKAKSDHPSDSWAIIRDMMESWWFGHGTGATLQKFTFDWDNAPVRPSSYDIDIDLNLSAFADADIEAAQKPATMSLKVQGWRTKVKVASTAREIGQ